MDESEVRVADISDSPTLSLAGATQHGVILGTAAYMSPEQAKGKPADRQADVWAFGACLFEALTGKRCFRGSDASELLAAVLLTEPDWEALPASVSPRLRRLLQGCLSKDKRQRWRDIGDVRLELAEVDTSSSELPAPIEASSPWMPRLQGVLLAGILAAILGVALMPWLHGGSRSPAEQSRLSLNVSTAPVAAPAAHPLAIPLGTVTISPDGRTVVYAAGRETGDGVNTQSYRRSIDKFDATPILGTEGAFNPVFSPDGAHLAFLTEEFVKRVPLPGGEPGVLCGARSTRSLAWASDGYLYFTHNEGLEVRVSEGGGSPELAESWGLSELPSGGGRLKPSWEGSMSRNVSWYPIVVTRPSGEKISTGVNGYGPRYVETGHLLFHRFDALFAAPFDPETGVVIGEAVQVLDGIFSDSIWATAYLDISETGTLVYVPGEDWSLSAPTIVGGEEENVELMSPASYNALRLSPNADLLAVHKTGPSDHIELYDFRKGSARRLTREGGFMTPFWGPSGKWVIMQHLSSTEPQAFSLFVKSVDNDEPARPLLSDEQQPKWDAVVAWIEANGHTPDGQYLSVGAALDTIAGAAGSSDIWLFPLEKGGTATPLLATEHHEMFPTISPDGRWLAYTSDKSGRFEVYVKAFKGEEEEQVSTTSGEEPMWSATGDRLFFRNGNQILVAAVDSEPELSIGTPEVAYEGDFHNSAGISYGVLDGGRRFVVNRPVAAGQELNEIRVITGFFDELERLVPGE